MGVLLLNNGLNICTFIIKNYYIKNHDMLMYTYESLMLISYRIYLYTTLLMIIIVLK